MEEIYHNCVFMKEIGDGEVTGILLTIVNDVTAEQRNFEISIEEAQLVKKWLEQHNI